MLFLKLNTYDNFLIVNIANFFFWVTIVLLKHILKQKTYYFFIFFSIPLVVPCVNLTYIRSGIFFNKIFFFHVIILLLVFLTILQLKSIVYLIILIWLGAFWSYNEILWNGYWNWNFIEYFNLIFLITIALIYHNKNSLVFYKYMYIVLTFFCFINHYPLIISVHNFINNNLLNYSVLITLIIVIKQNSLINTILMLYLLFYFYNFNIILVYKLFLLNFFFFNWNYCLPIIFVQINKINKNFSHFTYYIISLFIILHHFYNV